LAKNLRRDGRFSKALVFPLFIVFLYITLGQAKHGHELSMGLALNGLTETVTFLMYNKAPLQHTGHVINESPSYRNSPKHPKIHWKGFCSEVHI